MSTAPREHEGKHARWRRRVVAGAKLQVRPGCQVQAHFASDFAPCGCVTHQLEGIPATSVDWYTDPATDRFQLRCLACGLEWSRATLQTEGKRRRMLLTPDHPEERAARRARGR